MTGHDAMKYRFRWKESCHFASAAQPIGERIIELRGLKRRPLQREDVYQDALDPTSPFRKEVFRDDEPTAAKKHRLEIAGEILRGIDIIEVQVTHSGGGTKQVEVDVRTPLMQNVPGVGYEMMATVLSDEDLRQQALASIVQGLEGWRTKLANFKKLVQALDEVIRQAKEMLAEQSRRAARVRARRVSKRGASRAAA